MVNALLLEDDADIPEMRRLLDAGDADINETDDDGFTILLFAACGSPLRNIDAMRFLLGRGADPTARLLGGWTALHFVPHFLTRDNQDPDAIQASLEMVELLLAAGAHVDAQNSEGHTPLHLCCLNGCSELVRQLLRHGADDRLGYRHDEVSVDALAVATVQYDENPSPPRKEVLDLVRAVRQAGSWKRFEREPSVKLLALRHLALAGRATAPPDLLRLFGAPPIRPLVGATRTRSRRAKTSAARTPLPDEVFKLIIAFWHPPADRKSVV